MRITESCDMPNITSNPACDPEGTHKYEQRNGSIQVTMTIFLMIEVGLSFRSCTNQMLFR